MTIQTICDFCGNTTDGNSTEDDCILHIKRPGTSNWIILHFCKDECDKSFRDQLIESISANHKKVT